MKRLTGPTWPNLKGQGRGQSMGRSEVVTLGDLVPADLRCAHKDEPLSVDTERARFSWRDAGPGTGRRQTAYQVLVGHADETPSATAELVWDSGRVESDDTNDVAYAGAPLETAHRYWWKVRVWDEASRPSPYSETAVFETALGTDEWEAVLDRIGPRRQAVPAAVRPGASRPRRVGHEAGPLL